jgi:integrase
VLDRGIPHDELGAIERPLYRVAAMTGLRQGELLGLRWLHLDAAARKVRVRQIWVRGEFKSPKSRPADRRRATTDDPRESQAAMRAVVPAQRLEWPTPGCKRQGPGTRKRCRDSQVGAALFITRGALASAAGALMKGRGSISGATIASPRFRATARARYRAVAEARELRGGAWERASRSCRFGRVDFCGESTG